MTEIDSFCQIIRKRSEEHKIAIKLLYESNLYGQVISILRQELDSMVRVIYLLDKDLNTRKYLINQTLNNEKWTIPNSRSKITDRQMVDLADNFHGWSNSVYKLGCAFIHLSPLMDYYNTNPFDYLDIKENLDIIQHLNRYHNFPINYDLNMTNIIPLLIPVFNKVSDNLEYYITELENNIIGVN